MRRPRLARSTLRTLLAVTLATISPGDLVAASHPLRVAAGGRHLVDADGRPFLYLADTAWQLFHRLTLEEAERYLNDRAEKGFTVVQAVVLVVLDENAIALARGAGMAHVAAVSGGLDRRVNLANTSASPPSRPSVSSTAA